MRREFRSRLRVIATILVALALLLVVRLYFVQIVHGGMYALRAERQYVNASQTLYDRGSIYFTNKDGTLISAATLATGFLIAIDPEHLGDAEAAYAAINARTPIDHDAFMTAAAKKDDPYEVIVHHVSDEAGRAVSALNSTGVMVERERWRSYPAGDAAARVIGFVAYDNENNLAGRAGLEQEYNDALTRTGDGAFGNFFAELFANLNSFVVDAQSARQGDIITSVDPIVEQELDKELAKVQAKYSSQETGGIVMDPSTGEIVALDVLPSFDPNHFADQDPQTFGDPLAQDRYEFGSIMKALTMTSGLDSGAVTPSTTYNDTGCITVNSKKICNYDLKARGVIPMQQVLSQSLNVGASFIATKMGHDEMRSYFTNLGLGQKTGVDLPGETVGDIHNLNSPRDVEYDTASFGQGIAVTPVEMIRALSAIADNGYIVTPHVATAIRLESGVVKQFTYPPPVQIFKQPAIDEVTKMLTYVVDNNLANGHDSIPSISVGAKTGTAQMASPQGGYYANRYFHSFFGFFPATKPKYVILLFTRDPQHVDYASETLTEPFINLTHFLINYYNIPPDRASYENTH